MTSFIDGGTHSLREIQELVAQDKTLCNISKEQREEAIENLQLHRDLKKTGACASNTSASTDCRVTVAKINVEVRLETVFPIAPIHPLPDV
jgi:hypothetical protein